MPDAVDACDCAQTESYARLFGCPENSSAKISLSHRPGKHISAVSSSTKQGSPRPSASKDCCEFRDSTSPPRQHFWQPRKYHIHSTHTQVHTLTSSSSISTSVFSMSAATHVFGTYELLERILLELPLRQLLLSQRINKA